MTQPTAIRNGFGEIFSGELNFLLQSAVVNGCKSQVPPNRWPDASVAGDTLSIRLKLQPWGTIAPEQAESFHRRTWYLAHGMNDLTVDCWDCLVSHWLRSAASPDHMVWISVDEILAARGLSSHMTGHKRGGFSAEQRTAINECLLQLMCMHIEVLSAGLAATPVLSVGLNLKPEILLGKPQFRGIYYRPGPFFAHHFMGAGWPVRYLPQRALVYQPYREVWEKRLTRYLSYQWDRHSGGEIASLQVDREELLGTVRARSRAGMTKRRLERALHRLTADGVISAWAYAQPSAETVLISAPPEVVQFYAQPLAYAWVQQSALSPNPGRSPLSAHAVTALRVHLGISQEAMAHEFGISRSLLAHVERGTRRISPQVEQAVISWVLRSIG